MSAQQPSLEPKKGTVPLSARGQFPFSAPSLWQQPRVRVGLVAVLLLAALATALVRQASSGAERPALAPRAAAVFEGDRLLVAVALSKANEPTTRVEVQLLGTDGNVLAQQGTGPRDPSGGYRFTLAAAKAQAEKATLRIRLDRQHFDMPVKQILLSKGHETSLVCGQEFYAGTSAPFHCDVHGVRSARETLPLPATVSVR